MAITDMGIAQIREGLASKQFSAHEVAQASLDHIAKADAQVHAFLELTADAAMQAAQRVDDAIAAGTFDQLGPLAGVPVAFKDNMNLVARTPPARLICWKTTCPRTRPRAFSASSMPAVCRLAS